MKIGEMIAPRAAFGDGEMQEGQNWEPSTDNYFNERTQDVEKKKYSCRIVTGSSFAGYRCQLRQC